MSGSTPGSIRGIAILAGVLCGVGVGTATHAEMELESTEISCSWGEENPDPVSWPDLIREIRETPVTQVEDGNPPITLDENAVPFSGAIEEILRISPKIELPGDRR